jgi:hypothetical protein
MRYLLATLILLFVIQPYKAFNSTHRGDGNMPVVLTAGVSAKATGKAVDMFAGRVKEIYSLINEPALDMNVLELALKGYYQLKAEHKLKNANVLTIIDFRKSSNEKRFFLIDMLNFKLIKKSLVAHGRNSGDEYAKTFSNEPSSYKSSLGFYVTGETYSGNHGLSLRIDGQEPTNDKARERAVVIHAADYVCDNFINNNNRLGRSFGCPALPNDGYAQIVETIKNGSCLFLYYPETSYLKTSKYVNATNYLDAFTKEVVAGS